MPCLQCSCADQRKRIEEQVKDSQPSLIDVDKRLGSILKRLSMLTDVELETSLRTSKRTSMPLGTVLLANGLLTKEELRAVIQAQSLLKDKLVDEEALRRAMPHLKLQPLGIEGALRRIKWHRDSGMQSNRLGELLLAANILSHLQLAKGLAHHHSSMQPLGRTLTLLGAVSHRAVNYALVIQEKIRAGMISRTEGVSLLKTMCTATGAHGKMVLGTDKPVKDATLIDPDISRLGDLLIDSGVLKEDEVTMAAQVSERKSKLIGEVFVELGILSQGQLNAVLDVQRLLRVGLIFRRQAISTLQSMNKTSNLVSSLEKSLAEEVRKRLGEGEMLNSLTSNLNKRLQSIAHRLYIDVLNGSFDFEQAMLILNICIKDDCTVPEAAAKTGWTLSIQPTNAATLDLPEGEQIGWLTV